MALKRTLCIFITVFLVLSMIPAITLNAYAAFDESESGTWFETAFATWSGSDNGYKAYVRTLGAYDWRDDSAITGWLSSWEEVDSELVRKVDSIRDTWRVDIPGLPKGEYEIQIRSSSGTVLYTFENLETWSFPRDGAAFVPSNQNTFDGNHNFALDGAIGGYLPDGRVDPEAIVVYVTHEDMDTTLPSNIFSSGRGSTANVRTPIIVRFLGTVGSFETVNSSVANSGTVGPPGLSANRMRTIGAGNGNVTIEGIGPDATIFGWGISTSGAHNVVFRNLNFDQWFEDAIEINGSNTSTRGSNIWVHNNTFGYGQNKHLALGLDPDQAKGDGATDVTNHARNYTVSYNHYAGSSKVLLIGGGTGSISAHYGTLHHNRFSGSEERTPRVRNGRVHIFNNIYENIQGHEYHNQLLERNTGYGIGAAHNATVWAEGNIFDNVNFPFLRSRQGHARGHQAIDYVAGAGETATANAGFNHFFGDAPGFVVSKETATIGDFPDSIDGFRRTSDYMSGLTEEGLTSLKTAALAMQPNVFDAASMINFDPMQDIGIVVAAGSTTSNPNMSTSPAAQLDWSFRPSEGGVWPTSTQEQVEALRDEINTYAGAMPALVPDAAPVAPEISSVKVNEEKLSATSVTHIPTALTVVYADTFTIDWTAADVLAESYEIQWDKGNDEWETIEIVDASARPTSFITQDIDQFAHLKEILAKVEDPAAIYSFRVRAINAVGAGDWSNEYAIYGNGAVMATIIFDYAGGEGDVENKKLASGETYGELPQATREGYILLGWSTDETEDNIVTSATIVSASHTLTAIWDEDYTDGKIRIKLDGSNVVTVEDESAEYILSAANVDKLATLTLWVEVDGTYFEGKSFDGLNGFGMLGNVVWEEGSNSMWTGRITLANLSGSVTSEGYLDLFKMTFGIKEELGNTDVKLIRVDLSGYDDENKAVYFESVFRKDIVTTEVIEYFSPYDINRDGKVDQLDLTTAQLYYAARDDEANWDEAKIADVNNDGRVDIEDLILILNNIVW